MNIENRQPLLHITTDELIAVVRAHYAAQGFNVTDLRTLELQERSLPYISDTQMCGRLSFGLEKLPEGFGQ